MSNVEKISIALTQDMAAMVREAVETGEYATSSEVIRDALRDWKLKRVMQQHQIEELRRLWFEGLESGISGHLNVEELLQEARSRFEAERKSS